MTYRIDYLDKNHAFRLIEYGLDNKVIASRLHCHRTSISRMRRLYEKQRSRISEEPGNDDGVRAGAAI